MANTIFTACFTSISRPRWVLEKVCQKFWHFLPPPYNTTEERYKVPVATSSRIGISCTQGSNGISPDTRLPKFCWKIYQWSRSSMSMGAVLAQNGHPLAFAVCHWAAGSKHYQLTNRSNGHRFCSKTVAIVFSRPPICHLYRSPISKELTGTSFNIPWAA